MAQCIGVSPRSSTVFADIPQTQIIKATSSVWPEAEA